MALYELLSKENPALCESDLAHIKFLLGLLCAEEKRHVEAELLLRDSFRRYMQLAAKGDAEPYVERLETLKLQFQMIMSFAIIKYLKMALK